MRTAASRFGRIDGVVNNAGFMRNGYFEQMSPDKLDAMLDVHIRGVVLRHPGSLAELRRERDSGRVVMTSSAGGMFAMQGESNYAAAKAGVYGLCKALACEGREHGICVNAVLPMAATTISLPATRCPATRSVIRPVCGRRWRRGGTPKRSRRSSST